MRRYQQFAVNLAPRDLKDEGGLRHLDAATLPLDDVEARAVAALLTRLLKYAPDAALELKGYERGLERYPGEYTEAYRQRVLNAWAFWEGAGTVPGMMRALEHLGYGVRLGQLEASAENVLVSGILAATDTSVTLRPVNGDAARDSSFSVTVNGRTFTFDTVIFDEDFRYYQQNPTRIVEHGRDDQSIWAEFSIFLTPTQPIYTTDAWNDGSTWDAPGDTSLWDVTLGPLEPRRIVNVINLVKPARSRLKHLYLIPKPSTDYWDDQTTWNAPGDNSVWDGDLPIDLLTLI
ncbi:hypothetical protein [Deinococcus pimensis]|uniref:hypothetical protein n=1 Tax=Deinococcus pimensis TaxID=309888 RepID=UPI0004ADB0B4|nr:hypothetical protein [Deinococcus pimensis]